MYQEGEFTFLALDIEGFGRRSLQSQMALRSALLDILDQALKDASVYADADILDRGDGALAILKCTPLHVLTEVIPRFQVSLDAYNAKTSSHHLKLRLALHAGVAVYDERGGYIGQDVTFVFRMLDSDTMRRQLAMTARPIVLAVSDRVHEEVCKARAEDRRQVPKLGSLTFVTKETKARAWTAQLGRDIPYNVN